MSSASMLLKLNFLRKNVKKEKKNVVATKLNGLLKVRREHREN